MAETILVRLGTKQKERLEAMAASNKMSQTQFLNVLVDIAANSNGMKITETTNLNVIIDQEFERRINQFPVLNPEAIQEGVS